MATTGALLPSAVMVRAMRGVRAAGLLACWLLRARPGRHPRAALEH
ncbi:hypothetical protein [Plantactinospora sp. CA-290183]